MKEPDFDLSPHRFKRTMGIHHLPKREPRHCRWCNTRCEGRRTHWCSKECVDAYTVRANPGQAARMCFERDAYLCQICGCDAKAIRTEVVIWAGWFHRWQPRMWPRQYPPQEVRDFLKWLGAPSLEKQWYEMDHIVPVIEGGGCCGLDNLRTVCFQCHKQETKALAGRRAKVKLRAKSEKSDTFT